jgi:hypothetical protein
MLAKQRELKGAKQPHGRDKLIKLAMDEFKEKQDTIRGLWDQRTDR